MRSPTIRHGLFRLFLLAVVYGCCLVVATLFDGVDGAHVFCGWVLLHAAIHFGGWIWADLDDPKRTEAEKQADDFSKARW